VSGRLRREADQVWRCYVGHESGQRCVAPRGVTAGAVAEVWFRTAREGCEGGARGEGLATRCTPRLRRCMEASRCFALRC